jgi:hypothetical protein
MCRRGYIYAFGVSGNGGSSVFTNRGGMASITCCSRCRSCLWFQRQSCLRVMSTQAGSRSICALTSRPRRERGRSQSPTVLPRTVLSVCQHAKADVCVPRTGDGEAHEHDADAGADACKCAGPVARLPSKFSQVMRNLDPLRALPSDRQQCAPGTQRCRTLMLSTASPFQLPVVSY